MLLTIHLGYERLRSPRVSLHLVLVVSFVLQICGVVGLVGWLSFRQGQAAVNHLASELRHQVSVDVAHHLEDYLDAPKLINQVNQKAIQSGLIRLSDPDQMGQFFWQQTQLFDVSYINFGTPEGELVGAERKPNGHFGIDLLLRSKPGLLHEYAASATGDRTKLLDFYPYNHRQESWYTNAVQAGKPIWSEIYQWDGMPGVLAISASYPLYNKEQRLMGVLGVDQSISDISKTLRQLKISESSIVFIVERSGLLVASSSQHPAFQLVNEQAQRILATQSQDPLIRATATRMKQRFSDLKSLQSSQQLTFTVAGDRQFAQVLPWQDSWGLDWLIVVVAPESNFIGQIEANNRSTLLLCLTALVFSAYLAHLTSRWLATPILQLSSASKQIANGDLQQTVTVSPPLPWLPRIVEVEALAVSFNRMSHRLQDSFKALAATNADLEHRIEQRTLELSVSEQKFAKAFRCSPLGMAISTIRTGELIEVNESFTRLLGYGIEEVVGKTYTQLNLWHDLSDRDRILNLLQTQGAAMHHEVRLWSQSGDMVVVELSAELIQLNGESCVLWVSNDITARKAAEQKLQASLAEKELLLREIHHRVKNNLHVISNLLDLQADAIEDEQVLAFLSDSQDRIQSMALIHEHLYQSQHLGLIDIKDYIDRLANYLLFSYSHANSGIQLALDVEPLQLNVETAIPCGLLINELVTNSLKYAFPQHQIGTIHIQLYQDIEQNLHLNVWDNGVGMADELDWQNSTSLGLKLIRLFAQQLRATMQHSFAEGVHFHFTFQPLAYHPRF
jgi:PAS domain S-box-containing protein